jgi:hypothetical protein
VSSAAGEQNLSSDAFNRPPAVKYWTPFSIDMNVKDASGGCTPETWVVPLDCIHQYLINAEKGSAGMRILTAMQNEPVRQTFKAVYPSCATKDCLLLLMGIHIMMRLKDGDPATQGGKYPWVFMTFWWTGQDNGRKLPEPWKYYQMNVTQSPRDDSPAAADHNVCFNPYLEGVEQGGPQSNCVNCHTFAAWNPEPGHVSPVTTGAGILGAVPIGFTPDPKIAEPYKQQNRLTDFVWSMASYPGPKSSSSLKPAH